MFWIYWIYIEHVALTTLIYFRSRYRVMSVGNKFEMTAGITEKPIIEIIVKGEIKNEYKQKD